MKKKQIFAALTALAMTAALAGCGSAVVDEPEERVTVTNPVHETDRDGVMQETGLTMDAPEGAEQVTYAVIDGTEKLAQMGFVSDGTEYNYRMAVTDAKEDLSGMYFTWQNTEDTTVSYCPATVSWNEGAEGVIYWYDAVPGVGYSLSVDTGATRDLLCGMAEKLFAPLQGDSDGDTDETETSNIADSLVPVLERIASDCHPGTAGCTLTASAFAGELCDLFTTEAPEPAAVQQAVRDFCGTMSEEDNTLFAEQLELVISQYAEITGENGSEVLNDCGYTPSCEEWNTGVCSACMDRMSAELAAEKAYAEILKSYRDAASEGKTAQDYMDAGLNYMAPDTSIGYAMEDLDGDLTLELLIASTDEDDFNHCLVLDLYTIDENGAAKLIFQSAERDRYYGAGANLFNHVGSSSATDSFSQAEEYLNGEMAVVNTVVESSQYTLPTLTPLS